MPSTTSHARSSRAVGRCSDCTVSVSASSHQPSRPPSLPAAVWPSRRHSAPRPSALAQHSRRWPQNALDYLAPVARLRSVGQTLAATLSDLRNADVDLTALDDHGASGADVSVLARRFDEQLLQADLVDRSALLRLAAQSAQGDVAVPISGPLLLLDVAVPDEVTRRLVQALCGRASHSLATVPEGDERSLSALTEVPGAQMMPPPPPIREAD